MDYDVINLLVDLLRPKSGNNFFYTVVVSNITSNEVFTMLQLLK
jgi:hypothetical protein